MKYLTGYEGSVCVYIPRAVCVLQAGVEESVLENADEAGEIVALVMAGVVAQRRAAAAAAAEALIHAAEAEAEAARLQQVGAGFLYITPAINEGCTRSLRISHTSRRAPLQPVSKTQVPCTPYHPPNTAGV
jgi:hypothetical protein